MAASLTVQPVLVVVHAAVSRPVLTYFKNGDSLGPKCQILHRYLIKNKLCATAAQQYVFFFSCTEIKDAKTSSGIGSFESCGQTSDTQVSGNSRVSQTHLEENKKPNRQKLLP